MVRCSTKRTIKSILFVVVVFWLGLRWFFDSYHAWSIDRGEKFASHSPVFVILILSESYPRRSATFERLILFLDELRLPYIHRNEKDFSDYLTTDIPSVIILDHAPNVHLSNYATRYRIGLLIYLNDQCKNCIAIRYGQMHFQNVTYSTLHFAREHLRPVIDSVISPFEIEPSNKIIQLLRFEKNLPDFSHRHRSDVRCIGLRTDDDSFSAVIYVRDRRTFEKLTLLGVSMGDRTRQIQLSECLQHYWFIWPVLIDILKYLTSNRYDHYGFDRHIQIDIDDIFLGQPSRDRWKVNDVQALLRSQKFVRNIVPNFRYRLGFSGYYYQRGTGDENEADRFLIEHRNEFIWFHHTWKHNKLTNIHDGIALISSTETNIAFAKKHQLPLDDNYVVAPHHAGIYPINPLVYNLWRRIFGWNVTSTENYPYHYGPPMQRRGFIYQDISVLPRQTCGLFTTTRTYANYPNGSHRLERSLLGGRLFRMILVNPISIFMSHNVNYGADRLGNYVFSKLIYLVSNWTRLRLHGDMSTSALARKYFDQFYPQEQMPMFTNPCDDKMLMNLWMGNRSMCHIFPQFIIIGPQKTGTTALHTMLAHHPNLRPSKSSLSTYEEVQFFSNDTLYLNGIEWYLNRFNSGHSINFEKSATYFDSPLAVQRIRALLPNVRLIVMLTEPGARAYSRYQHEIVRTGEKFNFDRILQQQKSHLKQRCLLPGHYAEHLRRWFRFFPSEQIDIVDGDAFRRDPRPILDNIQTAFLRLKHPRNASEFVRFSKKKGFFCPKSSSTGVRPHLECLGTGKGRTYEAMSSFARRYLDDYYRSHNQNLIHLLRQSNFSLPSWLSDISIR